MQLHLTAVVGSYCIGVLGVPAAGAEGCPFSVNNVEAQPWGVIVLTVSALGGLDFLCCSHFLSLLVPFLDTLIISYPCLVVKGYKSNPLNWNGYKLQPDYPISGLHETIPGNLTVALVYLDPD